MSRRSKLYLLAAVAFAIALAATQRSVVEAGLHDVLTLTLAVPSTSNGLPRVLKFVARFHSVLLHFPIAFIALAFLLEGIAVVRPRADRARTITLVLVLSTLSAVVVATLGTMLASEGGYDQHTLRLHETFGFAVVILTLATTVAQAISRLRAPRRMPAAVYRGLLVVLVGMLVFVGHFGGDLTHGANYLVEYAPPFLQRLLDAGEPRGAPAIEAANAGERLFADTIRPIFANKCVQCHGPEKQKGGFRVDRSDSIFAGGDSERPAIVAGKPMESNLLRLVLLPPEDDDVMPPEGKERLSPEEIVAIAHWIGSGAPFVEEGAPRATIARRTADPPDRAPADASGAGDGPDPTDTVVSTLPDDNRPVDFVHEVKPILESHCIRCHGADRRKGRLELHTRETALRGGRKMGPAVVPGKPDESAIVRRITIPPTDDEEEEMMPPADEGGPLTRNEVQAVERWIREGAPWPEGMVLARGPDADKE